MKAPHSLIIGGTRGIGRELVDYFVRKGHTVSVIARHLPDRKVHRARARYWSADVRDDTTLRAILNRLVKETGKINHLVFFQRYRGCDDTWRGEIETSLTATKTVVEVLQDKFAAGEKAIVLVSSINAALIAGYLPLGYHVAKAALRQMVRSHSAPAAFASTASRRGLFSKRNRRDFSSVIGD
jgi:NAD(P)-dependent dehydrogenase (short-subunit alcohol dehydrogenase family)